MKKGLPTTSSPDDKNFNSILAIHSELASNRLKELAIIVALKEVAKQNNLSLKQQVEIFSPAHWNEPPGLNLDKQLQLLKMNFWLNSNID